MARRTFFSFHYKPDVQRAMVVRNSWMTKLDREEAGFYDSSVFESKQRTSEDALKRFLADGLVGTSVTAVLYTSQTAFRRWVRFELLKSFVEGKGILAIAIHSIPNFVKQTAVAGPNPLEKLGLTVTNDVISLHEVDATGKWVVAKDVGTVGLGRVPYTLSNGDAKTFAQLFINYDWAAHSGTQNLGAWIDAAAKAVGR